ncbi:hypothetical protein CNMCM5793_003715 [Aspergillus hiratsukae]|uniref:SNF2 N-terminal domain-containing protein n=1 Tax=Aspergillus hiratsukae TaxID=1194566 RepID=A0A8H6PE78_9EURO|nr:hypothetical protein CNMCM5793_003715 [Aspergillus hiratsukae]KAF7168538.1 hypothetical protein CNMCM6106_003676 [Aspergillus hiratsukae]
MAPSPITFTIKVKDGVSTANPTRTQPAALPLPPQTPSLPDIPRDQQSHFPMQAPTIGMCEQEMQERQRDSNSDGDGRARKHARTRRGDTPFPPPGLSTGLDTGDADSDPVPDIIKLHQATRKRWTQGADNGADGSTAVEVNGFLDSIWEEIEELDTGLEPEYEEEPNLQLEEEFEGELEPEVEPEVEYELEPVPEHEEEPAEEVIDIDGQGDKQQERENEAKKGTEKEQGGKQDGKSGRSARPGANGNPNDTVAQPKQVIIDLTLDDDDGSQDNGTDIDNGRVDLPNTLEVSSGDTEPGLDDSADNMAGDDFVEAAVLPQDQATKGNFGPHLLSTGDFGKKAEHKIGIPGLRRPLKPHQAFAVYWMLTTEKILNGGYLADDMGLGKTYTAIALCVISRWVHIAWQAVEESRAAKDGRHLLSDDQQPDAKCPSAAEFPICCPCIKGGPTAQYVKINHGPNLVVVPARLIPVWEEEWTKTVDDHHRLRMHLLIGHRTEVNGRETVQEFERKDWLTIKEAQQWLDARADMESLDASLHKETTRKLREASFQEPGTIPEDADRFVILSSPRSVELHVLKPLTLSRRAPVPKKGAGSRRGNDASHHAAMSSVLPVCH